MTTFHMRSGLICLGKKNETQISIFHAQIILSVIHQLEVGSIKQPQHIHPELFGTEPFSRGRKSEEGGQASI